jgi:hypothetical protein
MQRMQKTQTEGEIQFYAKAEIKQDTLSKLHQVRVLLEKLTVAPVKKFPFFYGTDSLPCSQEPSTGRNRESHDTSQWEIILTLFLYILDSCISDIHAFRLQLLGDGILKAVTI